MRKQSEQFEQEQQDYVDSLLEVNKELLESLENLVSWCECNYDHHETTMDKCIDAIAAINKAKGIK